MNYRHAFHAGNFADLVKHATLIALVEEITQAASAPFHILDTHAGAGVYDLDADMAQRTGEARGGVARLMADDAAPPVFGALKRAVRALNPGGGVRVYPGSPYLAVTALRPGDAYVGSELRRDDAALLAQTLAAHGGGRGTALAADGYIQIDQPPPPGVRRLILIDPPFESGDEYQAIVEAVRAALKADPTTTVAIWAPLKDLDTFDRFIGRVEALGPPSTLVAEARLRPLTDPLRMNGCAMVVVGCPPAAEAPIAAACAWTATALGELDGLARVWRTGAARR